MGPLEPLVVIKVYGYEAPRRSGYETPLHMGPHHSRAEEKGNGPPGLAGRFTTDESHSGHPTRGCIPRMTGVASNSQPGLNHDT